MFQWNYVLPQSFPKGNYLSYVTVGFSLLFHRKERSYLSKRKNQAIVSKEKKKFRWNEESDGNESEAEEKSIDSNTSDKESAKNEGNLEDDGVWKF